MPGDDDRSDREESEESALSLEQISKDVLVPETPDEITAAEQRTLDRAEKKNRARILQDVPPLSRAGFNRLYRVVAATAVSVSALLFAVLVVVGLSTLLGNAETVAKAPLHQAILSRVENGADLDVVRTAFRNRRRTPYRPFRIYSPRDSYNEPLTLGAVLQDIKSDLYEEQPDEQLVAKLQRLIEQEEQTNPFMKLEPTQRHWFNSLRSKLGDQYVLVKPDVEHIVEALDSANQTIYTYLRYSQESRVVAYVALAIGTLGVVISLGRWLGRRIANRGFRSLGKGDVPGAVDLRG